MRAEDRNSCVAHSGRPLRCDAMEQPRFAARVDPRPDDVVWPELAWPIAPSVELADANVRLTRLDLAADVDELFAALDHPQVWAHLPFVPTSVAEYGEILAVLCTREDWHVWTVRLERPVGGLEAGAIVGTTSFLDARVPEAAVEIGATSYSPAVWASAVNPACKRLLLAHAFEECGAGRVQIKTDIRNVRSQQAIARLGAHFEGVLRRHFRRADGTMRDTVMFSVIAEEWPSVRDGLDERLAGSP